MKKLDGKNLEVGGLSGFTHKSFLRGLCVFAVMVLAFAGCESKPKFSDIRLPLPPAVDSGLYDGQYVQADYGFGFPLPPQWLYLRLSADQEVDEVARFCDPGKQLVARVTVQVLDAGQKFSPGDWGPEAERKLVDRQFKISGKEKVRRFKTADSGSWTVASFGMTDPRAGEWEDEEWVLPKDDLLIGVHAAMPSRIAGTDKGKKLFKALEGGLGKIQWYTPIGTRGISVERFELLHFTDGFAQSLESGSLAKTGGFFDEMYPERAKWVAWYQQLTAGNPGTYALKAGLAGLVINGDLATASFTVTRKDKDGKSRNFERNFKLSKKEGNWAIISPLDKN